MSKNNELVTPSKIRKITNSEIQNILCQKTECMNINCCDCAFGDENIRKFRKDKEKYLKIFIEACRE